MVNKKLKEDEDAKPFMNDLIAKYFLSNEKYIELTKDLIVCTTNYTYEDLNGCEIVSGKELLRKDKYKNLTYERINRLTQIVIIGENYVFKNNHLLENYSKISDKNTEKQYGLT